MDDQNKKNLIDESAEIPFSELLDLLQADAYKITLRHLFRLSGLEGEEKEQVSLLWSDIDSDQRRTLLEDMEDLADTNTLVDFESMYIIALNDKDPQNRKIAARGLTESDSPAAIRPLLQRVHEDDNILVRVEAANTLGHFVYLGELGKFSAPRYQEFFDALFNTASSSDQPASLQQACLSSLGYASKPGIETLIDKTYNSDDVDSVSAALLAMGRSADPRWAEIVLEELENHESNIRLEAVRAAGQLELEAAIDVLIEYLTEEIQDIRHAAIWSLAEIGDKKALRYLETMQSESEDEDEQILLNEAIDQLQVSEDLQDFSFLDIPDADTDTD